MGEAISQDIISNKECTSLFVGNWNWIENNVYKDCFYITIGERNDSLLFSISGVFYVFLHNTSTFSPPASVVAKI